MRTFPTWICIRLSITLITAHAGEGSMWEANAKNPVPQGARVTVQCDKREYLLGENALLHFTLENASDKEFEADFGGDYRGATRPLRFKVSAIDESARMAEDPDTSQFCLGGFGGPRKLKPGEKFVQSLALMRYRRIVQPGRYTIRVTHDFGWKEGERKRPGGEISLNFLMPTPEQAEAVVAAMEKLPSAADNTYGERAQNYADFSALRLPVYLRPLLHRAEKGNQTALQGIGWIASPDATSGLIKLSTNANPKMALQAARTLTMRLPDPNLDSTNGFGGFPPFTREARRHLVRNSWDPKFAAAVRSLATNYLAMSETPEPAAAGAVMLQAVGTTNEAPAVRVALDLRLGQLVRPRDDPKDNILDQPGEIRELLNAMNVLHSRGYMIGENQLSGEAAFLLYFTWLANQPAPRPARWLELLNVFGENARYPTRVAALNSIPEPVPGDCFAFVKARLADADLGVVRAACTVAGKSNNKDFVTPLLEIIATEHHEWLLREATDAARKLGAGFDLLDAWADRLTEQNICHLALENLSTIIEGNSGVGSDQSLTKTRGDRIALRRAWRTFLAEHAEEIRQGKKFKAGDSALPAALIGREPMPPQPK